MRQPPADKALQQDRFRNRQLHREVPKPIQVTPTRRIVKQVIPFDDHGIAIVRNNSAPGDCDISVAIKNREIHRFTARQRRDKTLKSALVKSLGRALSG